VEEEEEKEEEKKEEVVVLEKAGSKESEPSMEGPPKDIIPIEMREEVKSDDEISHPLEVHQSEEENLDESDPI